MDNNIRIPHTFEFQWTQHLACYLTMSIINDWFNFKIIKNLKKKKILQNNRFIMTELIELRSAKTFGTKRSVSQPNFEKAEQSFPLKICDPFQVIPL